MEGRQIGKNINLMVYIHPQITKRFSNQEEIIFNYSK